MSYDPAMPKQLPAVLPILASGYHCTCQRCGHEWMSICECLAQMRRAGSTKYPPHKPNCATPLRCPGCKSVGWQKPAAWSNPKKPKAGRPPGRLKG